MDHCLTCDVRVPPRPPLWDKHSDVPVAELPEVLHCDRYAAAAEEPLQAVPGGGTTSLGYSG